MKRFMPIVFVPFVAFAACDSDSDTKADADVTSPADGDTTQQETVVTPGVSALTGVDTRVTVTTPTPNAGCDPTKVDNNPNGAKYPFPGLEADGKSYTCDKCPAGLSEFQGKWRAHGFAEDETTPDYDLGSDASTGDAEVLFIDGNTWYSQLHDKQLGQSVETRGWLLCSQKPEHPNEHLFWTTLSANPAGNLGAQNGDINESDVILSSGSDKVLIAWYDEVGGNTSAQIGYCKIGTSSGGKECNNPFD